MIKKAEEQNMLENSHIDGEVTAMKSNIDLMRGIRQNIERTRDMSYEDIMNTQETVNGIIENNKANFSGVKSYGFPVF